MAKSPQDTAIAGGIATLMVVVFIILIVGIAWYRAVQGGM